MCLAFPGRVIRIDGLSATVDFFGVTKVCRLDLLDGPLQPGDYVLNQAGFAIHRIPDDEVGETVALFETILASAEPQDLVAAEGR